MYDKSKYEEDGYQLVAPKSKTLDLLKTPRGDHTQHMRKLAQNLTYREDDSCGEGISSFAKPPHTLASQHFSIDGNQHLEDKSYRFDGGWPPHKPSFEIGENSINQRISFRSRGFYGSDSEEQNDEDKRENNELGNRPQKKPKEIMKKKRPKEKGLKSLSQLCLDIIQKQGLTSYKLVAQALIDQMKSNGQLKQNQKKQESNVRRRVYDALNVFYSIGLLVKQDREIKFVKKTPRQSLPMNMKQPPQNPQELQTKIQEMKKLVTEKRKNLDALKLKVEKLNELIERNRIRTESGKQIKIRFPFVGIAYENLLKQTIAIKNQSVTMNCKGNYSFFGDMEAIASIEFPTQKPKKKSKRV